MLTGSFSTGAIGATHPVGICHIPGDGFAILAYSLADGFIVNTSGILQRQFDVGFIATNPLGIAYEPATGNFPIASGNQAELFFIDDDICDTRPSVKSRTSPPKDPPEGQERTAPAGRGAGVIRNALTEKTVIVPAPADMMSRYAGEGGGYAGADGGRGEEEWPASFMDGWAWQDRVQPRLNQFDGSGSGS